MRPIDWRVTGISVKRCKNCAGEFHAPDPKAEHCDRDACLRSRSTLRKKTREARAVNEIERAIVAPGIMRRSPKRSA